MIRKWVLTLLVCVSIALVLVSYKVVNNRFIEGINASAPEYSETVEAATVELIDYQPVASVLGQVVMPRQVELRNEVAGIVAEVNFESGARVEKGQLLIQLDISEEQAQLQSAMARAELARITKQRLAKLRESRTVSQEQYDKALAEAKVSEAEIAMIEASISKKTLRAPFEAIAGLHQFEAGQYLEENALITRLVGLQDFVWIDFSLSQNYGALSDQARVIIAPLSDVGRGVSATMNWAPITAQVIAHESVMTRASRSLNYRAELKAGKAFLPANAIVSVKVPIAQAHKKLAIPAIAVLHSSAGSYVYVLNEQSQTEPETETPPTYRAHRQPVILGDQQGDLVIVESGLEQGQRIASAGAFKLSEGLLTFLHGSSQTVVEKGEHAVKALDSETEL